MTRIINGLAVADNYEQIVGPIEGYERPEVVEATDFSPADKPAKHRAEPETKVVTKAVAADG